MAMTVAFILSCWKYFGVMISRILVVAVGRGWVFRALVRAKKNSSRGALLVSMVEPHCCGRAICMLGM